MTTTQAIVIAAIAAVAGAVATYLVARRATSGRVGTSNAGELWAASVDLRHDLRDELVASRVEVRDLRVELLGLRAQLAELPALRAELKGLRNELGEDRRARNGG